MTSLLTRVGSLESRLASQAIQNSSKRKRTEWICAECKARKALRQRRAYGDDSLRVTPAQYLFNARSSQNEEAEERRPIRSNHRSSGHFSFRPFGLGREENEARQSETAIEQEEIQLSDDGKQDALWEGFERHEEETGEQVQTDTVASEVDTPWISSHREPLLDIDYATELTRALANNEPDMVARCLYAAERTNDLDFIRSIPRTTFSECIRILQPSNFIVPLANAHLEISEAVTKQLGLTPVREVAWQHMKMLRDMLEIRRSAGINVALPEYKMLLRSARDLGDRKASNSIWHLLFSDGLRPDTTCYNYMMASNVWNGILQPQPRRTMRVIRFFQLARRNARPGLAFANYRVGKGGLKEQVMHVFSDMLKNGAIANEESFCNVIMAAGREGDLSMVKSILRKVWDIDVDALIASTDEVAIVAKGIQETSSVPPTSRLLFALGHTFSINNDMPTALRVVDFVARKYEIDISVDVWKELFEWTFVLAISRTGVKARTDTTKTGQLPKQSVLSLWHTMTGPPYFIKPTMGMYNHLIKNLQDRSHAPELRDKMYEGRQLYQDSVRQSRRAFDKLKRAVESEGQTTSASTENLRRDFEYLDVIRKRNLFWCKRWLRLFLTTLRSFTRVDKQNDWDTREVPRMLWEWRHLAPTVVSYTSATGVVELTMRTQEEIEANRADVLERRRVRDEVLQKVPLFASENWIRPARSVAWRQSSLGGESLKRGQREEAEILRPSTSELDHRDVYIE